MPTVEIRLPGTIDAEAAGLDPVMMVDANGFPSIGLQNLFLFEDGSGTAPVNEVAGADPAFIEHQIALPVAGTHTWLATGTGGGLELTGPEIVSTPELSIIDPWTILYAFEVTGSVGDTVSTKNYAILSWKAASASTYRGHLLYAQGGADVNWNDGTNTVPFWTHRVSNGTGGFQLAENLLPATGLDFIGHGRVAVVTYDGVSQLISTIYDKDGNVMATDTYTTVNDTLLSTGFSGAIDTAPQPSIGPALASQTYSWGKMNAEVYANYNRVLGIDEIKQWISIAADKASVRGRPW